MGASCRQRLIFPALSSRERFTQSGRSSSIRRLVLLCSGAARVALGTEVPVVFCNDDEVAAKLHAVSGGVFDQVRRREASPRALPTIQHAQ